MMIAIVFVSGNSRNTFSISGNLIVSHAGHGVLFGQHGLYQPGVLPLPQAASALSKTVLSCVPARSWAAGAPRATIKSGCSLSGQRAEIFDKFSFGGVVAFYSRDEGWSRMFSGHGDCRFSSF